MSDQPQQAMLVPILTHGCECGRDMCATHKGISEALTQAHAAGRREGLEASATVADGLLARVAELELRRSETVAMCVQLQAENARLQEYLEASAWRISPAMAQAKVDELNATVERLTAERDEAIRVGRENAQTFADREARLALTWTTAKPTEEGRWWWRHNAASEAKIYRLIRWPIANDYRTFWCDTGSGWLRPDDLGGEWAGPIPLPKEVQS